MTDQSTIFDTSRPASWISFDIGYCLLHQNKFASCELSTYNTVEPRSSFSLPIREKYISQIADTLSLYCIEVQGTSPENATPSTNICIKFIS